MQCSWMRNKCNFIRSYAPQTNSNTTQDCETSTDRRIIHRRPLLVSANVSGVKRLFPGTAAHDPPRPCHYSFPRWRRSAAFAVASPPWGSHFCWPQWISFSEFKQSCNSLTLSPTQDLPCVTQSVGAQKGESRRIAFMVFEEILHLVKCHISGQMSKICAKKGL